MTFATPIRDMQFVMKHMAGFDRVVETGAFEDLSDDLVEAVLSEAGKVADNVIAPLNWAGDQEGARLENGVVYCPKGYKEAYAQMVEGGWNALAFPEEVGGQGLPMSLALSVTDAMSSACLSFQLVNILSTGAVKALLAVGTDEQKAMYLPKLITGEWSGTMNLTEPQSGSDLSKIATKAEPVGDGRYKITGSKIYISFGEQDMCENICHLVLARLPDAPEGTRGISMFLVPKFLVNEDGSLGARNDVKCTGIEEKLGQHGSPTCSLSFGDSGDCYGTLVGKENEGLRNMFIMMNSARIDVGVQGVACAERAFQTALAFAQERKQGREFGVKSGDYISIIQHADVRRMLYTMKSMTEASRAICYATMVAYDVAKNSPDEETRKLAKEREELLTPIAKSWSTDRAVETTNIGIQVHGGMGFVEESQAAQPMRDVRVTTIYEGTNGIQAIDLIGRKLGMGQGKLAHDFIAEVRENAGALKASSNADLQAVGTRLETAAAELEGTTNWLMKHMAQNPEDGLAGATPYQDQFGYVAGAHYLAKGAAAAAELASGDAGSAAYYNSKIAMARFFADNILPRAHALTPAVTAGADTVAAIEPELLAG
jgi:alkylation response protein AidB-like acyl-CoA dehydrogenase